MDEMSRIDELLLAHTTANWQKVAMVIATTLTEQEDVLDDIDDTLLVRRIQYLAHTGRLESRGNLDKIRNSEIRLPFIAQLKTEAGN